MRSNCMSKALCFLQITAKLQDYPFFTVFLIIKTSSQNISITLLKISLKSHEHRGCYCWKKLPWTILEKQFPVPRNTAARKIGNGIIPLLWQLRCYWNPYHNKFSSSSSTTVLTPGNFPKSLFIATEFILKRRRYWPWITAPSHKCNNKLDCFLHEMLLITDSFFIKSNLQEPLKNVFSVRDLGLENIFSVIIKRLLISTFFFFQFRHLEGLFFCIYNGLFKLAMMIL